MTGESLWDRPGSACIISKLKLDFIKTLYNARNKGMAMGMEFYIIFWYGLLHAFGPDHLVAIADFSIAKERKKALLIVAAFALGHGIALFVFAKLLQAYALSPALLEYGDFISSLVIIFMGIYLLYLVAADRIHLRVHQHARTEHIHIWFGQKHAHSEKMASISVFGIAALMGIGGVRGMLVSLGALQAEAVDMTMILFFVLGVSTVFVLFGLLVLFVNRNFLGSIKSVRRIFATAGVLSIAVGGSMLY